ncbi:MAG: UDP-N-acetylmuramoyl-L-alanine--D-glutamate ligase [Candidatus Nealsonbacteria bacterium]|nr:UDP-N-acetylmuramoyl-L-alanine--D-glutamate ligase [Candidatus Nealsonbacteria bacterium]
MKLKDLKNREIVILGFGREGRDTFGFLRENFPEKELGIADMLDLSSLSKESQKIIENDQKTITHLGEDYLEKIKDYEVIVKSPGVPPEIIEPYIAKKQRVTSQTEIFFKACPGKIIGVTGTKGKSTTVALINKVLKDNEFDSHLVGNIGKPALSFLEHATPEDIYIYELSSHQLAGLEDSPHIAVLLNIFPEHLDYYKDFSDYVSAKANITYHQTEKDYLIYDAQNETVKKIAQKSKAQKITLSSVKLKETNFPLKGKFNLKNIKAAIAVTKIFDIPRKKIIKSIQDFKPLPYRLEYLGTYKGIKFYNDALSTIPEATMAALDALGEDVETILLGGYDRGISFKKLVKKLLKSKIKTLIFFQTTGDIIWRELIKQQESSSPTESIAEKYNAFMVQNMKDAVKLSFKYTHKGKICLLSTASPSFGIFRDYREKGDLFKKYVEEYGQKK